MHILYYTAYYYNTLQYGEPWARVIMYYSTPVEWILLTSLDSRMTGPPGSPRSADARKNTSQRLNRDSGIVMYTRAHATHMMLLHYWSNHQISSSSAQCSAYSSTVYTSVVQYIHSSAQWSAAHQLSAVQYTVALS